jgi:hypothetical protein
MQKDASMQAHRRTGCRAERRPAREGRSADAPVHPLGALARLSLCAAAVAALGAPPARALDDRDICVLAEQLAQAAERDVGIWIDRLTRNAGMVVSCKQMTIEYRRFSYAPATAMTAAWKARKGADWNATHCASAVWKDAILRGWKVMLSETSADGGQASFTARCE